MSDASPLQPAANRTRLFVPMVLAMVGLLCVAGIVIFVGVGRWLVFEDRLEKASAIVVLSGRMPVRALEAGRLYRAGYASEVWLTRAFEPAASLQSMHIAYIGEEFFNSEVLVHEGVPANAVHVLEPNIDNTADEVRVVCSELGRTNSAAVIIVTTKAHTRRVRTLWKQLCGGRRAIVRATSDDPFDRAHWWRNTRDAVDVVREVLGLLNAWAGLPVRSTN